MPFFSQSNKTPLGIYIHIPFCGRKCLYCDFYSITDEEQTLWDRYTDALCRHIREAGELAPNYVVDTVYFGGGTPSLFGADRLSAVLSAVRKSFTVAHDAEVTLEANPDSVDLRQMRRLHSEGFTRVSLGIQCDDDAILNKIGRLHSYRQAEDAVHYIRRAGFRNLSVDLMYGLPDQTLNGWRKTLTHVLALKPEHISCYGLKLEEGTPLYRQRNSYTMADDDTQADMYLAAIRILREHGFRQYEISNFCRKGQVSRHNLKYWTGGEYLGFGPDASSDFAGQRFSMVRDVQSYIDGILSGGQVLRDVQTIPNRERAGEYLMMRLRIASGLDPKEYEKQFLLPFAPLEQAMEQAKEKGLAIRTIDGRWHLTPEGFLLSNTLISDLLLIQDECQPLNKRR